MRYIYEIEPGLVQTVQKWLGRPDEVRCGELVRLLNRRREVWLQLDNDLQLVENLLELFAESPESDHVLRMLVLMLTKSLICAPDFPLDQFDARSTPWLPSLQISRSDDVIAWYWSMYISLKALLRDPAVIDEVATEWRATDTGPDSHSKQHVRSRAILTLGSVGSEKATRLLSHWLHEARNEKELHAMQFELILLDWTVDPLPEFAPLQLARDGMAVLAESYLAGRPHPELLHFLRTDGCRNCVRHHCLSRPHLRRLCRGPDDWATNLVRNLSRG